ncbi:MAG: glycosyltransferase family A protein [Ginsengibacter sp.]
MNVEESPMVSCIMPTYNRRAFVPYAIQYFLRQDYPQKELIIIDDGTDKIEDIVPENSLIRYYRLENKISVGAKRNFCNNESKGDIIMHWDDDDWYSSKRISYQMNALLKEQSEICGINNLLYLDLLNKNAYMYVYQPGQRTWLAGSSMCYFKRLWENNKFDEINVGEDGLFIWRVSSKQITVLSDITISIHTIHDNNVCPKNPTEKSWSIYSVDKIKKIVGEDWMFYMSDSFK